MTWISTWPLHNCPQFAEHPTEQAAAEHAKTLRATGHREAIYFWLVDAEEAS